MATRRGFMKGAAALPLVGAAGVLLAPGQAKAWVPVALAVAQAGFQLYQMSRSGGGGIGKLLAAQVEMLRAINSQLREIGQIVTQIYAGVEELKDMVEALPLEVTRQIYRTEVRAVTEFGSRLLDNGLINTQNRGIANAIALDNGASQQTLDRLGPAVNAVIADPSILNVPLMCLAWYTEYQLMTRYVPFNPGRIATTAAQYKAYFGAQLTKIEEALQAAEAEAAVLAANLATSPDYESADCYEDRWQHNPLRYSLTFGATFVQYEPGLEPFEGGLSAFVAAASNLREAGVTLPPALLTQVPLWKFSSKKETAGLYGSWTRAQWRAMNERLRTTPVCVDGRSKLVGDYYGIQESVKSSADSLRVRFVVLSHLRLATLGALESSDTIAQRVRQLNI